MDQVMKVIELGLLAIGVLVLVAIPIVWFTGAVAHKAMERIGNKYTESMQESLETYKESVSKREEEYKQALRDIIKEGAIR